MNHQQWLDWRRGGLGASDAPIVMGVSPFKTLRQLWEDKVHGKEEEDNPGMKRGREMEEEARRSFEKIMDVSVFPTRKVHKDMDWLRATLDGIDLDEKVMVEIKCPNKEDHALALSKKVPEKYYPQCQHQMLVTGLSSMYYFSYDGENGVVLELRRNDDYIAEMLEKEKAFWSKVVNKTPLEFSEEDFLDLNNNIAWEQHAKAWRETKNELKRLEDKEKVIRQEMLKASNNKNAFGYGVKMAKSVCQGAIDYKAVLTEYLDNIRSHYPDVILPELDYDVFRKESFTKWTIRDTE